MWFYERAERQPSDAALEAIEDGQALIVADVRPFGGSADVYKTGPDGVALWDVLSGDEDACYKAIADALKHTAEWALENPSGALGAKIEAMYAVMLHDDTLARITSEHNGWPDLSAWVNGKQPNLVEVEAEELAAENTEYGDDTQQYSIGQLAAVMALWILARRDFTYKLETTYLLQGIFYRAVGETLPEIAQELEQWFGEGLGWVPTVGSKHIEPAAPLGPIDLTDL